MTLRPLFITFCAACVTVATWSIPADARHNGYRAFHRHTHHSARLFGPPMIGGFALGSATYMYHGFNPCLWQGLCAVAGPIVRVRY